MTTPSARRFFRFQTGSLGTCEREQFDPQAIFNGSVEPLGAELSGSEGLVAVLEGTDEPLDADLSGSAGPAADLTGADPVDDF